MNNFIVLNKVSKSFTVNRKINVLNKVSYKFLKGKIYSIVGPSGSGKSTLLNIMSLIDRPTSGIVILSKTSKALSRMNSIFKNREIKKLYWCIISKSFPKDHGTLTGWFRKNSKLNKSFVYDKKVNNSKLGSLKYKKIKDFKRYSLFEVNLETGRHHQIRTHFSKLGYPIVGDLKYGAKRSLKDGSIHLHSRRIIFQHPIKKVKIDLIAEPPKNALWTASLFD